MALNLFSNSKAIKEAKEAQAQMNRSAAVGMEAADTNRQQLIASEQGKANVFAALGQDNYQTGTGTGTYGTGQTNMYQTGVKPSEAAKQLAPKLMKKMERQGIIDPEGYANSIIGTTPFKIRSQQTAEAMQLLNREGPAWNDLENATLGSIYQGAAEDYRAQIRELKRQYAKGGSARRTAFNEAMTLKAMDDAHTMVTEQSWQANLRLRDYVNQNADRVQAGNIQFVDTLPGFSEAYRNASQAAASLMVSAAEKAAIISNEAYAVRASERAKNVGSQLLEGVIMAATSSALGKFSGPVGDFISGLGTPGEFSGKFTNFLGGTISDLGGTMSTSLKNYSETGSLYTAPQEEAVAKAEGRDLNQEALNAQTGVKYVPGASTSGWFLNNQQMKPV